MKTYRLTSIVLVALLFSSLRLFGGAAPGEAVGWGVNTAGQVTGSPAVVLSNGVLVSVASSFATGRVEIAGHILTNAVSIAAGSFFGLALRSDGTVVGWGSSSGGAPDPHWKDGVVTVEGRILDDVISIAAGNSYALALRRDGTVVAWGANRVPKGLTNIVGIASRGFFSLGIRGDGTVVSWSSAPWGERRVPDGLSNVVAVAAGGVGGGDYSRNMALKRDGTVVVWGEGGRYESVPAEASNIVAIASGGVHSLALRSDGTVLGWGYNGEGQATGVATPEDPAQPNFASDTVTLDGQVLTNVVAISAASAYNLALKRDGKVVAWGDKRRYREVPSQLTNVVSIVAGEGFCLAITTNVDGVRP